MPKVLMRFYARKLVCVGRLHRSVGWRAADPNDAHAHANPMALPSCAGEVGDLFENKCKKVDLEFLNSSNLMQGGGGTNGQDRGRRRVGRASGAPPPAAMRA